MKINKFEDLEIWQLSVKLTKEIYVLIKKEGFNKDFSLKEQIRRAVISISSNISEGFEKNNNNEFIRFLKIAKGSAGEVRSQAYLALEIGYLDKKEFEEICGSVVLLSSKIGRFISYLEDQRMRGNFITR